MAQETTRIVTDTSGPEADLDAQLADGVRAYPKPGAPDFPALELEVLDYWDRDDTFRASVAQRDGAPEYVFYDGPPFAS